MLALHGAPAWAAAASGASPEPEPPPRLAPEPPNYWLPALEIGAALGLGAAWYWIDDRNVFDWDKPSIEQRLNGEAWRFDNNTLALNYLWHPAEGASFYFMARANRLGWLGSFGYAVAGSTAWEYLIEFNEKVSINDMWVTPLAGVALGEPLFKLAWKLAGKSEPWSRLELGYGFGLASRAGGGAAALHAVGFDARLVSLAGYRGAATQGGWFHEAEHTSFSARLDAVEGGLGAELSGRTLPLGYRLPAKRGESNLVGLGVGSEYRDSRALGFDDQRGLLHFPGLALELSRRRAGLVAELDAGAFVSFGSLSATGYAAWRARQPELRTKTVLERHGYFYGWGGAAAARGSLTYGAWGLDAHVAWVRLHSIEGLDRSQERVQQDVSLLETAGDFELAARVDAEPLPLSLRLRLLHRLRASEVAGSAEQGASGSLVLFETALRL